MIVAATIVRAVIYAHTGLRVQVAGHSIDMPTRYLRQIRKEPHYLDGGVVLGAASAVIIELATVGQVIAPAIF